MAKDQKLKLTYATTSEVIDRGPEGVRITIIGQNTTGTKVSITGTFDDWSIREIASKFAAILTNRVKTAIENREHFKEIISEKIR